MKFGVCGVSCTRTIYVNERFRSGQRSCAQHADCSFRKHSQPTSHRCVKWTVWHTGKSSISRPVEIRTHLPSWIQFVAIRQILWIYRQRKRKHYWWNRKWKKNAKMLNCWMSCFWRFRNWKLMSWITTHNKSEFIYAIFIALFFFHFSKSKIFGFGVKNNLFVGNVFSCVKIGVGVHLKLKHSNNWDWMLNTIRTLCLQYSKVPLDVANKSKCFFKLFCWI